MKTNFDGAILGVKLKLVERWLSKLFLHPDVGCLDDNAADLEDGIRCVNGTMENLWLLFWFKFEV